MPYTPLFPGDLTMVTDARPRVLSGTMPPWPIGVPAGTRVNET